MTPRELDDARQPTFRLPSAQNPLFIRRLGAFRRNTQRFRFCVVVLHITAPARKQPFRYAETEELADQFILSWRLVRTADETDPDHLSITGQADCTHCREPANLEHGLTTLR